MADRNPKLHFVCGKAASGKSTLCIELAKQAGTIVVSEDKWLSALYGSEMSTLSDYVKYSSRLRDIISLHVFDLLKSNVSVVVDFPVNTVESRNWMREMITASGAEHTLHFLDVPDSVCIARLGERNRSGVHPFTLTIEQYRQLANHFVPPSESEGFHVLLHRFEAG